MTLAHGITLDPDAERRRSTDRRNTGSAAAPVASEERRRVIPDRRDALHTVEQAQTELARLLAVNQTVNAAAERAEAEWTHTLAAYEKAESQWTNLRAERSRMRAALIKVQTRLAELQRP